MSIQPGAGYIFTSSGQGTNLNILKPLETYTSLAYDIEFPKHPFKVTDLGPKTAGGVTTYWFTVQPGLVNNLDPMIASSAYFMTHMPVSDYEFVYYQFTFNPTTNFAWIVLKLGYDAATDTFPDSDTSHVSASPSYPAVGCLSYEPTTDNVDAYLTIAKAYQNPTTKKITISQYVTGSLWSLRVRFGTTAALYYYNRI
jgi:hypothetical protein